MSHHYKDELDSVDQPIVGYQAQAEPSKEVALFVRTPKQMAENKSYRVLLAMSVDQLRSIVTQALDILGRIDLVEDNAQPPEDETAGQAGKES